MGGPRAASCAHLCARALANRQNGGQSRTRHPRRTEEDTTHSAPAQTGTHGTLEMANSNTDQIRILKKQK